MVVFLNQAYGVIQHKCQHPLFKRMVFDGVAKKALQRLYACNAAMKAMRTVHERNQLIDGLRLERIEAKVPLQAAQLYYGLDALVLNGLLLVRVFIHFLVHARVVWRHHQRVLQAARVVSCNSQVECAETLGGASRAIRIQHAAWPGIAGKGQLCDGVLAGVDIEKGGRSVVVARDAGIAQQCFVGGGWRIGVELTQIAIGSNLVGLPDFLIQQDIQVTGAQRAYTQACFSE
ncbi:hypothetical protein D3C78_1228160 [compost metagenome]